MAQPFLRPAANEKLNSSLRMLRMAFSLLNESIHTEKLSKIFCCVGR